MSRTKSVNNFLNEIKKTTLKDLFKGLSLVNIHECLDELDTKYFDSVAFYKGLENSQMMKFASKSEIQHIINTGDKQSLKHFVVALLMNMYPKLFEEDSFGALNSIFSASSKAIDKFLKLGEADFPEDKDILSINFSSSSDKDLVIDKVFNDIDKIPGAKRYKNEILLMVDELFTNALYNAPTTVMGSFSPSRKNSVVLDSSREAIIQIAYNVEEKVVLIGCTDLFGTLAPNDLIKKITSTYELGIDNSISFSANGGAGIGVRLLFEKAESMTICVQKEEKTCIMFSVNLGLKKGEDVNKSIHLLQS